MVRADYPGVFATYKTLKDGTRRAYWYHRATGCGSKESLVSEPSS